MSDAGRTSSQTPKSADDGKSSPTRAAETKTAPVTMSAEARTGISIPSTIGQFRIGEEIGRGGMGVVFRGWDTVLHRDVAIKILPTLAAKTGDPRFERFFAGARAEAAIRHPNIVSVYTAGLVEGVPYLVMDYIDGPTLRELIQRARPLPFSVAVKVMWDVAGAASALHEHHVLHRDLKPGNVLFDRAAHVFVTDFGLASLRRPGSPDSPAGTPAYMAPEVFDGKASPQSDVYAMGITLFELLTGRLPFSSDQAAIRDQHAKAPLPLSELGESVPAPIAELIERAAHKKEMYRYKSAEHFQRALRDAAASDDVLREGSAELQKLVLKLHKNDSVRPQRIEKRDRPSSNSYFERLSEIADEKRTARQPSDKVNAKPGREVDHAGAQTVHPNEEAKRGALRVGERAATAGTLAFDVPCIGCNYNLRSLALLGVCPECRAAISPSLNPNRLIFADPKWLAGAERGLTVVIWALLAGAVLVLGGHALGQAFPGNLVLLRTVEVPGSVTQHWLNVFVLGAEMAFPVTVVALGLGVFMSTKRDGSLRSGLLQTVCRHGARLSIILLALAAAEHFGRLYAWKVRPSAGFLVFSQVLSLAAGLAVSSFLFHLCTIAARVPDLKLVRWSIAIAVVFGAIILILDVGLGIASSRFAAPFLILPSVAAIFALIVQHRRMLRRVRAGCIVHEDLFRDASIAAVLALDEGEAALPSSAVNGERASLDSSVNGPTAKSSTPASLILWPIFFARRQLGRLEQLYMWPPEADQFPTDEQRRAALREFARGLVRSWRFWIVMVVMSAVLVSMSTLLREVFARYTPFSSWTMPVVLLLIVGNGAVLWVIRRQMPRRLRMSLLVCDVPICLPCGYVLRGLPLSSQCCPECGRPFDDKVRGMLSRQECTAAARASDYEPPL